MNDMEAGISYRGEAAACNLHTFHFMSDSGNPLAVSALTAFFVAASVNYRLQPESELRRA